MRQTLELLDGRKYVTEDGWQTVWKLDDNDLFVVTGNEASHIRYLALVQQGTHEDKPKR